MKLIQSFRISFTKTLYKFHDNFHPAQSLGVHIHVYAVIAGESNTTQSLGVHIHGYAVIAGESNTAQSLGVHIHGYAVIVAESNTAQSLENWRAIIRYINSNKNRNAMSLQPVVRY